MSVSGLTFNTALSLLAESEPTAHRSINEQRVKLSIIEPLKTRNFALSITSGVVTAVTVIAGYVFALAKHVIIPGGDLAIVFGTVGVILGSLAAAFPLWYGGDFASDKLLEHYTVKPLLQLRTDLVSYRDSSARMYLENNSAVLSSEKLLTTLVKKCDFKSLKLLAKEMNFEQLRITKTIVSKRTFTALTHKKLQEPHHKFRLLAEFEGYDTARKLATLQQENLFTFMLRAHPDMLLELKQQTFNPQAAPLIKAIDTYIDQTALPTHLQTTTPLDTAILIVKGYKQVPENFDEIKALSTIAWKHSVIGLPRLLAKKVLALTLDKTISNVEALNFFASCQAPESSYTELKALMLSAFSQNKDFTLSEILQLWKNSENWPQMRKILVANLNKVINISKTFKEAYECAIALDSQVLAETCLDKLRSAPNEYKTTVRALYGVTNMPDAIFAILNPLHV